VSVNGELFSFAGLNHEQWANLLVRRGSGLRRSPIAAAEDRVRSNAAI
jgi:hypothetical protein